jgi:ribulose-phosphate 3-epimerase
MSPARDRRLAPSILSADFASLAREIAKVEPHAGLLHVDVMDGRFVPNITIGPPVVAALKRVTALPLDCHLMIEAPERYLKAFAQAGASHLSVHQETCPHLHRTVQSIRELGMHPGVALNPATPVETLDLVLPDLDFVLIMSVNPGFGGLDLAVEVDGGVAADTLPRLLEAGADWFVAGSAIFHAPDAAEAARTLSELLRG